LLKKFFNNNLVNMNKFIKKLFRNTKSPYFSVLPYNINWLLSDNDNITCDSMDSPIVIVDVGCRGGVPDELWPIRSFIHYIGFDADSEECRRIEGVPHDYLKRSVYSVFIGSQNGIHDFNLFNSRGDSSMLDPNNRHRILFGGPGFRVDKSINVETTTMDTFFEIKTELPRPDLIKLDTQGTELDILRGASNCLKTCLMVEVEVEFTRAYNDQPLFDEVMTFMLKNGFELLYLNRVFQQKRGYQGYGRGQVTFGDALFARREDELDELSNEKVINLARLLINYGHYDSAYTALKSRDFLNDNRVVKIFKFLERKRDRYSIYKLKRFLVPFIDKIIVLLLNFRKHNHLTFDSDRSWPIR